ncbi:MAG: hypothetical protein KJ674_00615 [Nanoarchaeota archaeon]|nr:hypothetical protein [Nanoarchaeota archaeon]
MEEFEKIIEEEKTPLIKRISIIILSIFLIFLVVSYLLTNSSVRNVVVGLVESEKLVNYEVKISEDNKLVFTESTYDQLMDIFDVHTEVEFKVCLKGEVIDGDYFIDYIYIPTTYSQSYNRVVAEPCSDDSLIDMHSHPLKHCLPSEKDLNNFENFKEKNENAMMAIMCQRDRFNFYF